jgi:hypothetical protein
LNYRKDFRKKTRQDYPEAGNYQNPNKGEKDLRHPVCFSSLILMRIISPINDARLASFLPYARLDWKR